MLLRVYTARYPFTLLPGDGRGWRETVSSGSVRCSLTFHASGSRGKGKKGWGEESSLESLDNYLELGGGTCRDCEDDRIVCQDCEAICL